MHRPIYPWLICVYPILHLYSQNVGSVNDDEVLVAAVASLGATTLLFLFLRAALASAQKSALITAILLFVVFSYGHIEIPLAERGFERVELWLLPSTAVITAVLVMVVLRRPATTNLDLLNPALNVAGLVMIAAPIVGIASYTVQILSLDMEELFAVGSHAERTRQIPDGPEHPDVYYIVLDGYSSNGYYERVWGYDNTPFTRALEDLGFFVAYDSMSSYGGTLLSLASSLNMRYVPENTASTADIDDLLYLRKLIADSEVASAFVERGYTYVFMLSGYLIPSVTADVNIEFYPSGIREFDFGSAVSDLRGVDTDAVRAGHFFKGPFYPVLLDTTLLRVAGARFDSLGEAQDRPYRDTDPRRFLATLERAKQIPAMPEATFSFVHLLEPHAPIQFDRQGRRLRRPPRGREMIPAFFAELEFVNERILDLVEAILAGSRTPPIIILQGDHGSFLGDGWTLDRRPTHFEILNALYLQRSPKAPEGRVPGVRRDLSPINTFRVLQNALFGTNFEELEVRLIDFPKGYEAPFEQFDVTEEFSRTARPRDEGTAPSR